MAIGRPVSLTNNVASKVISVTATASQTLFTVTGGYRINQLSVFRNGVRLVDGTDYTARDGATVTLLSPASASDVLEFQIFDDFRVADAIVSSESDQTIYGNLTVTGTFIGNTPDSGWISTDVGIHTLSNVGIGTTNPTSKLTVGGDVNVTGVVTANAFSGNFSVTQTSTNGNFYPLLVSSIVSGNRQLFVDNGQISYNPSTNRLELFNLNVNSELNLVDDVELNFGTSKDAWFNYNGTGNYLELQLESAATDFRITDNGTERFRFVKSTGNLGIGTTNPTAKLVIDGGVGAATTVGTATTSAVVYGALESTVIQNTVLNNYSEKIQNLGTISDSATINIVDGLYVKAGLGSTCIIGFSTVGVNTAGVIGFTLELKNLNNGIGTHTITWPGNVIWPGGSAPIRTTTQDRTDIWTFLSSDAGTNWIGNIAILNLNV